MARDDDQRVENRTEGCGECQKTQEGWVAHDFSIKEFYFPQLTHILISGLLAESAWPKNAHSRQGSAARIILRGEFPP
jgi:hypothetical protein